MAGNAREAEYPARDEDKAPHMEQETIELEAEAERRQKLAADTLLDLSGAVDAASGLSPPQKSQLTAELATLHKTLKEEGAS